MSDEKRQGDTLNIMQDAFESHLNDKYTGIMILSKQYPAGLVLRRTDPIKFMEKCIEWMTDNDSYPKGPENE